MERKVQDYEKDDELLEDKAKVEPEEEEDEHPNIEVRVEEPEDKPLEVAVASDEPEEEEDEEKVEKDPLKQKLHRIQKEKFQAIEQKHQAIDRITQLERENEELRRSSHLASQAAMVNHDDRVNYRINNAKQQKMQAIESGDVQAQVDADLELSLAVSEYDRLQNWKASQSLQSQYPEQQQAVVPEVLNARTLNAWEEQNPWANSSSDDYDEALTNQAHHIGNQLNQWCHANGLSHEIYSPQYFQRLDQEIAHLRNQNQDEPYSQRRAIPMKNSKSPVSSMRGTSSSRISQPQKQTVSLSRVELDTAAELGMTAKEYAANKLQAIKEGRMSYQRAGGR